VKIFNEVFFSKLLSTLLKVSKVAVLMSVSLALFSLSFTYAKHLENEEKKEKKYAILKGQILDRNNIVLAKSENTFDLFIKPSIMKNKEDFIKKISPIIDIDAVVSIDAIKKRENYIFQYLHRDLTYVQMVAVLKIRTPIINPSEIDYGFLSNQKRVYPQRDVAGPLLGFEFSEHTGWGGFEMMCSSYLEPLSEQEYLFLNEVPRCFMWVV